MGRPYPSASGRNPDKHARPGRRRAPRGRAPGWWGSRAGRFGVAIVIGCAAVGALVTMLTGSQPGLVLGVLLVAGTVCAALSVRPRAAYLIIPVPALSYVAAATIAGLVNDRGTDASLAGLAVSAAQWIADGFLAMAAATAAAIAITVGRSLRSRRGPRGPGYPPRAGPGRPFPAGDSRPGS